MNETCSARYVGRVGALAVALGIGSAVATAPAVAWAEPDSSSTAAPSGEKEASAATETKADTEADAQPTAPVSSTATAVTPSTAATQTTSSVKTTTPKKPRKNDRKHSTSATAGTSATKSTAEPSKQTAPTADTDTPTSVSIARALPTASAVSGTTLTTLTAATATVATVRTPAPTPAVTLARTGAAIASALNQFVARILGTVNSIASPLAWIMAAATRREIGQTEDTETVAVEAQTFTSLSLATATTAVPNQQPVFVAPTLGDPDPTTGAVSGQLTASDPEGKVVTYALVTGPTLGTVTVGKTGTFTYTPTAAQRVSAGVTTEPDATFIVSASDGKTAKVLSTVAVPIDPTPVHLLSPVSTGQATAIAATDTRAYLTNSSAGTLTVVNTLDGTVVKTMTVGTNPIAVAVKPDGKVVYVADGTSNTITVIDGATNTVTRTVALTIAPTSMVIYPSGGTLYVGNATGKLAKVSTSTIKVTGWVSAVGATSVIVSPDGKRVYATTPAGVVTYTVSSGSTKVIAITGTSPTAVAASKDGKKLYVVTDGTTVKVLDTSKFAGLAEFSTTSAVQAATVNKDGSLLMVTTQSGELQVYNTATSALLMTLATGDTVNAIAASPDGMQLYTAGGAAMRVVSLVPTNVKPVVGLPVTTSSTLTGVVSGLTGVTDADDDPQTVTVLTAPTKGKVTFAGDGTFTYTPTAAARHLAAADTALTTDLTDTFTFTVSDGRRGIVSQTITVTVIPANKAPTITTTKGNPNSSTGVITGSVTGTDGDKDKVYYDGTTSTLTGTLVVGGDGKYTYTPTVTARHAAAAGGPSTETFTVTVDDGHGSVTPVSVTLNISPFNTVPTAATVSTPVTNSSTARVTGQITTTDADNDTLTYTATAAAKGTVVVNTDGSFSYTPTALARATGASTDAFTVTISDGHGGSRTVTVNVNVVASAAGNTLPVNPTYSTTVNATTGVVTGQVSATDASTLSYALASPVSGVVVTTAGAYTYTPSTTARYHAWFTPGADTLTFTVNVSDGLDGIPVDVTVPITALHPDSDGTLTLSELQTLATTGDVDVTLTSSSKVRDISGTFTVSTVTNAATAATVLNKMAGLLGAPSGFATASQIAVSSVGYSGSVFYRLSQTVNGVPVVGSEVVLSTDSAGRVTGLVSNYDAAITSVNTTPISTINTAAKAEAIAKDDALADFGGSPSQATEDAFAATLIFDTDLVIYDQDVSTNLATGARWNPATLAWRVVTSSDPTSPYPSVGATYYIYANGAKAGTIFSDFSSAQQALVPIRSSGTDLQGKTRTVGASNTGTQLVLVDPTRNITTYLTTYVSSGWSGQPSVPGSTVTYSKSWGTAAVSAQSNMTRVYDYYTTILGRDSFDDNGAAVILSIDYNPSGSSAAGWRNAAWTGRELVFGDSGSTQAALDLVGHEYTHAVIQYVNGLAYLGDSGALNEAYADIMGALIENKTGSGRWLFAEDAAGNPYRSMEDPSDYSQRESYPQRYIDPCGCNDNDTDDFDYVHSNSGIMSFAAYKMMDATKNEISGEQWAQVYYESLYSLPSTASYIDARFAILTSARANGFTAKQIAAIRTAFDAVGVKSI
ncbi:MAG: M4 family metallopeptidase [Mycolicibacterium cosmeticum]|nr:M4 family metallopeptidase [Mycolicibacterium cosmeticum]